MVPIHNMLYLVQRNGDRFQEIPIALVAFSSLVPREHEDEPKKPLVQDRIQLKALCRDAFRREHAPYLLSSVVCDES